MPALLVTYEILWRSRAQQAWISAVMCKRHVEMVRARVPVKIVLDKSISGECCVCRGEQKHKERQASQGNCRDSPISDGFPPSRANAHLKAS